MVDNSGKLLGDRTSERMRKLRLDRVAKQYTRLTGKPCGCAQRAKLLNNLHTKINDIRVTRNKKYDT